MTTAVQERRRNMIEVHQPLQRQVNDISRRQSDNQKWTHVLPKRYRINLK